MSTNPGVPEELHDPDRLRGLMAAALLSARDQTTDEHLVDDAVDHALEALMRAVVRPNGPTQESWERYVRTAATNYARHEDRRSKRTQPMGWAGSAVGADGGGNGDGEGEGRALLNRILQRQHAARSLGSDVAAADANERLLEELAPLDRRLIIGKYIDGIPIAQLAQDERITAKAVEHRLRRARNSLREIAERDR